MTAAELGGRNFGSARRAGCRGCVFAVRVATGFALATTTHGVSSDVGAGGSGRGSGTGCVGGVDFPFFVFLEFRVSVSAGATLPFSLLGGRCRRSLRRRRRVRNGLRWCTRRPGDRSDNRRRGSGFELFPSPSPFLYSWPGWLWAPLSQIRLPRGVGCPRRRPSLHGPECASSPIRADSSLVWTLASTIAHISSVKGLLFASSSTTLRRSEAFSSSSSLTKVSRRALSSFAFFLSSSRQAIAADSGCSTYRVTMLITRLNAFCDVPFKLPDFFTLARPMCPHSIRSSEDGAVFVRIGPWEVAATLHGAVAPPVLHRSFSAPPPASNGCVPAAPS
ncbi:hypothetical protein O3G_MSEX012645 [Manduca sexta]|uniref:Uncharacterized protein n=1 Tax=Manduca sexta TaxID=7130 RepID=A0A922CVW0_MANSE|nr:hypothetical protein O3G_MSEX012645 [Manduca sexta]